MPYGSRHTTGLEIEPEQANDVKRIFDLVRTGSTIRATAATMTEETGRQWQPTVIERIVKREAYKLAEPGRIVDARIWNAAQRSVASRKRR
jgi:hypothetical protein